MQLKQYFERKGFFMSKFEKVPTGFLHKLTELYLNTKT